MIEQARIFADLEHKDIRLYVEHDISVDEWIRKNHYLHSVPAGAIIRLCIKDKAQHVVGCMMWGRPSSRKIDQYAILELTRMCFIDNTPPFIESQCLGMARKYIRKHLSRVKGLIAYCSTGAGHEKTVYKADNWYMLGGSAGGSWETRENCTNRDLSLKIRWTRSP